MNGIITYGSLLNLDELEGLYENFEVFKVRVYGFRRHCGQESTFRKTDEYDAVLTVEPDEESWFNGLLITGFSDGEFEAYLDRESGYSIERVDGSDISFYEEYGIDLGEFEEIVVPIGEMELENPNPVPEYIELCTVGAFEHGSQFGRDFVLTTDWS